MSSRIFAFIESKYSSQIEGVYTTLFDNINTSLETKKQKLIKPIINALFKEKNILDYGFISEIADNLNVDKNKEKRWENEFGIYKNSKEKIYEPPMKKEELKNMLKFLFNKIKKDKNIIDYIITHIIFEKIHPFIDGNGRIGRLILQKQLVNEMNFSKIIPISWSIYNSMSLYYESLDVASYDIDKSILLYFKIINKTVTNTIEFIKSLKTFVEKNIKNIKKISNKIDDNLAKRILLTIQMPRHYLEKKNKLNPRTIDKIYNALNNELDLPFNTKIIKRKKYYWNISLEEIINHYYG